MSPWRAFVLCVVAGAVLTLAGAARAQVLREGFEPPLYDLEGRPIRRSKQEICREKAEGGRAACVSRALQKPDLKPSDSSFYARCERRYQDVYRRCMSTRK